MFRQHLLQIRSPYHTPSFSHTHHLLHTSLTPSPSSHLPHISHHLLPHISHHLLPHTSLTSHTIFFPTLPSHLTPSPSPHLPRIISSLPSSYQHDGVVITGPTISEGDTMSLHVREVFLCLFGCACTQTFVIFYLPCLRMICLSLPLLKLRKTEKREFLATFADLSYRHIKSKLLSYPLKINDLLCLNSPGGTTDVIYLNSPRGDHWYELP